MKKKAKLIYPVLFILLIAWIAFLSFYKLDVKYVDPWDEARHGVNAYEMANGGSLFQNTYLRQADYYNLKPPLSMWCIIISMAIFGNTVFALRFYSALCYVLLAVAAGLFIKKKFGKAESLFAVAFLAMNTTAFQAHMIRAGDADSVFVLLFALVFGAIGFLDDWEKLKKKQNLGLSAKSKFLLQLAAALVFILLMRRIGYVSPNLYIPFANISIPMPEWL